MRRTVIVKIQAENDQDYALALAAIDAIRHVTSWRASSFNKTIRTALAAVGVRTVWMPGSTADALKVRS